MEKLWIMIAIGVGYGISNQIVKQLTGIRPTGWSFWIYDIPASVAGILTGYFVLH